MIRTTSVILPEETKKRLKTITKVTGFNQSQIVRTAITRYLDEEEKRHGISTYTPKQYKEATLDEWLEGRI